MKDLLHPKFIPIQHSRLSLNKIKAKTIYKLEDQLRVIKHSLENKSRLKYLTFSFIFSISYIVLHSPEFLSFFLFFFGGTGV
jgi:hypothetical protein